MHHHLIWWINIVVGMVIIGASIGGLTVYSSRKEVFDQPKIAQRSSVLPKSPTFDQAAEAYMKTGEQLLHLNFEIPKTRIPDLRPSLQYHGYNKRPDATASDLLFFSLGNSKQIQNVKAGTANYLVVDPQAEGGFRWSTDNKPTDLWFTAQAKGPQSIVVVRTQDENGEVVDQPSDRAQFSLPEKPIQAGAEIWNLGKWRVDGTFLIRLGAKWNGRDLFLEKHGGEEYQALQGKQRIVFGPGEETYSVYVSQGDLLIWKDDKWHTPSAREKTEGYPLLKIEKIDERILTGTLYDSSGKRKQVLNLIRSNDPFPPRQIEKDFQFAGARTRVHSMFKIDNKREIVGPGDWFLLSKENGWKKLKTSKEVDDYVLGHLSGALLIIDKLEKQNEEKWFEATLFNLSRSASLPVIIPLTAKDKEAKKEAEVKLPSEAIEAPSSEDLRKDRQ